jgi:hypothetical protein
MRFVALKGGIFVRADTITSVRPHTVPGTVAYVVLYSGEEAEYIQQKFDSTEERDNFISDLVYTIEEAVNETSKV